MADYLDMKVALVGPSDSGKSSLVKFLRGMNFEPDNSSQFEQATYQETWGIQVNILEWEYITSNQQTKKFRFNFWEAGGNFLRKFDFYTDYLIQKANLIIYTVSLNDENIMDKLQSQIRSTRERFKSNLKLGNEPCEIIFITKADQAPYMLRDSFYQDIEELCKKEGIKGNYRILGIPYSEKPNNIQELIEQSTIFDEEGLLRNVPFAKHELITQIFDQISSLLLQK